MESAPRNFPAASVFNGTVIPSPLLLEHEDALAAIPAHQDCGPLVICRHRVLATTDRISTIKAQRKSLTAVEAGLFVATRTESRAMFRVWQSFMPLRKWLISFPFAHSLISTKHKLPFLPMVGDG